MIKLQMLVSMLLLGCIFAPCSAVEIPVTAVQLKREGSNWKALVEHKLDNTQDTKLEITLPQQLDGGPDFIVVESAAEWSYKLETVAVPVTNFDWKQLATDGTPVRVSQGTTQVTGVIAFQDDKLVVVSESITDGVRYTPIDPKKVTAIDDLSRKQASTKKLVLRRVLSAGAAVDAVEVSVQYQLPTRSPEFRYELTVVDHTKQTVSQLAAFVSCRNDTGVDWPKSVALSVEFGKCLVAFDHNAIPVGVESTHPLGDKQVHVRWMWPVLDDGLAAAPYLDITEPETLVGYPSGVCIVRIPGFEPQATEATFRKNTALQLPPPQEFAWQTNVQRQLDDNGTYAIGIQGPWLFRYTIQHVELTVSGAKPTLIPVQFRMAHANDLEVEWKPGNWQGNTLTGQFRSKPKTVPGPIDIRTLDVAQLDRMKTERATDEDQATFETWVELLSSRDTWVVEQKQLAQSVRAIDLRQQLDTTYRLSQADQEIIDQAALNESALATIQQQMQRLAATGLHTKGSSLYEVVP